MTGATSKFMLSTCAPIAEKNISKLCRDQESDGMNVH